MAYTYSEQLRRHIGRYREEGNSWPATTRDMAVWLIGNNLWEESSESVIRRCAADLATAMREEYTTDPQGRSVRTKHAARLEGEQAPLWADIHDASPDHMRVALQQRRQQIVGDCKQLKTDMDSYNDNYNTDRHIQLSFDFTRDLEELEAMEGD
ncbi:MAG: hypothetical protein OXE87_16720 [Chloroflexi bacterium]|nr:hypothetical protein [Chloroflexota bacterium]